VQIKNLAWRSNLNQSCRENDQNMLKSGPQVSLRGCPTLRKFLSLKFGVTVSKYPTSMPYNSQTRPSQSKLDKVVVLT
jgi:hypothetical protein